MADSITLDADGYIVKNDPYDLGVRMKPAVPGVAYEHPEDAHSSAPKRGDYTGRVQPRVHYRRGRYNVFGEFVPDGRS
jgi:hypothetical protein